MEIELLSNLAFYVPELIIALTMCFLLFIEAGYGNQEKGRPLTFITALVGLVSALVALSCNIQSAPVGIFKNAVSIDTFGTFIKLILVIGTLGVVILAKLSNEIYFNLKTEFYAIAMGILVGGMLLVSANNMLTVYLGVETLSILSYVVSSFKKDEAKSTEAGLKYALYGGIAAGIMLYGMGHIYGTLGTIQFSTMIPELSILAFSKKMILGVSFILFFVGIGYKIACVPFHMWSPDVYQGSPVPVTSFFAIVPKLAAIGCLVRITHVFFLNNSELQIVWVGLLNIVAALTMTVGNVSAIGQDSVKRMLAFSSIGHVGFMLLGILVLNSDGDSSILFYGTSYLFMTLVAFFITSFVTDQMGSDSMNNFKGLIYKHPLMTIVMTIIMFSLAGMPPFSGFVAKYNILSVVINKKNYGLALVAAINSVISLYYYMKLVKTMIFDKSESDEKIEGFGFLNQFVISVFCIPVIVLGICWESLLKAANGAKIFIP